MGAHGSAPRIGAISKSIHTPAYERLLKVLREARTQAGLSQRALAERLAEHHSWVAKVELGERRLDIVEFVRVARALKCDPQRLFRKVTRAIGR